MKDTEKKPQVEHMRTAERIDSLSIPVPAHVIEIMAKTLIRSVRPAYEDPQIRQKFEEYLLNRQGRKEKE